MEDSRCKKKDRICQVEQTKNRYLNDDSKIKVREGVCDVADNLLFVCTQHFIQVQNVVWIMIKCFKVIQPMKFTPAIRKFFGCCIFRTREKFEWVEK